MKRGMLSGLLFLSTLVVFAQDEVSWSILHNKKKIFSATQENAQKNIISVKLSDLKPANSFIISYSAANIDHSRNQWKRTIGIYNETDKELLRKDTSTVKLSDTQLKKMLQENKTIKIFTWSIPKDPKEAARVRIRRVHLCTIELK